MVARRSDCAECVLCLAGHDRIHCGANRTNCPQCGLTGSGGCSRIGVKCDVSVRLDRIEDRLHKCQRMGACYLFDLCPRRLATLQCVKFIRVEGL